MMPFVQKIPGEMPKGWDTSVVYFANLLSLFYGNEAEIEVLRNEVGSLETYGSRLLPVINLIFGGRDNVLILQRAPDAILPQYFKDQLKLTLPHIEILPHEQYRLFGDQSHDDKELLKSFISKIKSLPAKRLDGYVTDLSLERLASKTGKQLMTGFTASHNGNNKVLLHQYLKNKDLLLFDTIIASDVAKVDEALAQFKKMGYKKAVIKSAVGASGIGMIKVDVNQPVDVPEYLFFEGPVLVQGWLDGSVKGVQYIGSPSVQLFVKDDSISLYDVTEQILSKDSIHEGNVAPSVQLQGEEQVYQELLRQAEICGQWLFDLGYRGTASVDFHFVKRNGCNEVRICEINARVTGATYPSMLARNFLPKGAWLMRNIRFDPLQKSQVILDVLNEEGLLFCQGKEKGVLPFNLNGTDCGHVNKGQFLFLGKKLDDVWKLLGDMQQIEKLKGVYDRD